MSRWKTAAGMAKSQEAVEAASKVIDTPTETIRIAAVISDSKTLLRRRIIEIVGSNHKIEWLSYKHLKDGKTEELDGFNNSNLLIVDFTEGDRRPFLSFQLVVREHLCGNPTVVLIENSDPDACLRLMSAKYIYGPFKILGNPEQVVINQGMQLQETITFEDFLAPILKRTTSMTKPLATKVMRFREGIRRARSNETSVEERFKDLFHLEGMLRSDPALVTGAHLMDLLLTYRDLKAWPDMIRLIKTNVRDAPAAKLPKIQYYVAFALNRRNLGRDREEALAICESVCEKMPSVDAFGLKGSIYKEMFIESIYAGGEKDYESCEKGIEAYRDCFKLEENFYGGVNLITLLYTSETYQERQEEIQQICSTLNTKFALSGGLNRCENYWDVASFFEVNVVGEIYALTNQAAPVMFNFATANWMLETTMKNVKLIQKIRKQREAYAFEPVDASEANSDSRVEYEFWCEFFISATSKSESIVSSYLHDVKHKATNRFPAIIKSTGASRPCYVTIHPGIEQDASVEVMDVILPTSSDRPSVARKFGLSKVRSLVLESKPHVLDTNFIDKRQINVGVVTIKGTHSFSLQFASQELRQQFYDLALSEGFVPPTEDSNLEEEKLEWEFDCIGNERRVLGVGATATVFAGINKKTNEEIAIKELQMVHSSAAVDVEEEVRTIRHLQHHNIIKFLGCEKTETIFRLFMEAIPGGSLTDLLNKFGSLLTAPVIMVEYTNQILDALKYLHGCEIAHRDVKGDNVLVNTYSGTLKLADFGTCKRMAGLSNKTSTIAGTPWYMAPEVIQSDTNEYGIESDIWSFGCTVWQMANGRPPFIDIEDSSQVMEVIGILRASPEIDSSWPQDLKDFLEACFKVEVKDRPSADVLSYNKYLTGRQNALNNALSAFGRSSASSISSNSSKPRRMTQMQMSIIESEASALTSALTTTLSSTLSSSESVEQGDASVFDQWAYPQLRQNIVTKVSKLFSKYNKQIVAKWISNLHANSTTPLNDESHTQRFVEIVDLITSQIDKGNNNVSSSQFNSRINVLLFAFGKPKTAEYEAAVNELRRQIELLKPVKGTFVPHFLVEFLRDSEESIQPHWVFFIEDIIKNAVNEILSTLDILTNKDDNLTAHPTPSKATSDSTHLNQSHLVTPRISASERGFEQKLLAPILDGDNNDDDALLANSDYRFEQRMKLFFDKIMTMPVTTHNLTIAEQLAPSRPKDPKLTSFIENLGISCLVSEALLAEHITFDVLVNDIDKDDLKDVKLPVGIRSRIWKAVETERFNLGYRSVGHASPCPQDTTTTLDGAVKSSI